MSRCQKKNWSFAGRSPVRFVTPRKARSMTAAISALRSAMPGRCARYTGVPQSHSRASAPPSSQSQAGTALTTRGTKPVARAVDLSSDLAPPSSGEDAVRNAWLLCDRW